MLLQLVLLRDHEATPYRRTHCHGLSACCRTRLTILSPSTRLTILSPSLYFSPLIICARGDRQAREHCSEVLRLNLLLLTTPENVCGGVSESRAWSMQPVYRATLWRLRRLPSRL